MAGRSESKIDPAPIVRAHYATLKDATTGAVRRRDWAEQVMLPVVVGGLVGVLDASISPATGVAILTIAGLFAAFLFQLIIQLLDRASGWAGEAPTVGRSTSRHAALLTELSANAAYASLVASVTATISLCVAISTAGWPERILAAVTIGLLLHLGITLLMVTRRVYLLTESRLREIRTGALPK